MTAIRLAHAGADYEVVVGRLSDALPKIAAIANGVLLPVISDPRVQHLHGELLATIAMPDPILVPQGEAAKDWGTLAAVIDALAARKVKRGTPIIALGGGSVGDVAGLAASLFKRGCPIIHVPTTLLAQADSAIGGKTAIDGAGQKNLVGTFHHPLLVVADPALLETLDARQMRSGYAEVVKYGLIDDPDFFAWCEANGERLLAGDAPARQAAVEHCVRTKVRFVLADPQDTNGARALLNFGHTFGHAIEAAAGHQVMHGEAVSVGMILALRLSSELGMSRPGDAERVRAHFTAVGLPTELAHVGLSGSADQLLALMSQDKKADREGIALVLSHGIGEASLIRGIDGATLAQFLRDVA